MTAACPFTVRVAWDAVSPQAGTIDVEGRQSEWSISYSTLRELATEVGGPLQARLHRSVAGLRPNLSVHAMFDRGWSRFDDQAAIAIAYLSSFDAADDCDAFPRQYRSRWQAD